MSTLLKVEQIYYTPKRFTLFKKNKRNESILKDISFEVKHGEVLGIVGESGSGKTTLAKVISGILKHEKGRITFNPKNENKKSNRIQILFQNTNELINPLRKVGSILSESYSDKDKLDEICRLLDIQDYQFDKIGSQLSGGERQRVGLARILSVDPELLILDEPFSAQDPESQENFVDLFKKIKSELDITIICVSHDIKLLKKLADNVIVLFGGKIMEAGNAGKVFDLHRHPYTQFLNEAFEYELKRSDFVNSPDKIDSDSACSYYSRCNRRTDNCKSKVEEFNSDDVVIYCNNPL